MPTLVSIIAILCVCVCQHLLFVLGPADDEAVAMWQTLGTHGVRCDVEALGYCGTSR